MTSSGPGRARPAPMIPDRTARWAVGSAGRPPSTGRSGSAGPPGIRGRSAAQWPPTCAPRPRGRRRRSGAARCVALPGRPVARPTASRRRRPPIPAGLLAPGRSTRPSGARWSWPRSAGCAAVRTVDRAHPRTPCRASDRAFLARPRRRSLVALQSPIERYDTTLFSLHMVQHILLTLVARAAARPGAPITLAPAVRRGPRRAAGVDPAGPPPLPGRGSLTFPVVAWLLFARRCGARTSRRSSTRRSRSRPSTSSSTCSTSSRRCCSGGRSSRSTRARGGCASPARALYTFLADAPEHVPRRSRSTRATAPLYAHYATLAPDWGPSVLADQQLAGALMWVVGDLDFLVAILCIVVGWMRTRSARRAPPTRARTRERVAIREREVAAGRAAGAGARRGLTAGRRAQAQPPREDRRRVAALGVDVAAADDGDDRPGRVGPGPASAAWKHIAARASAPDGSATRRASSRGDADGSAISSSVTVTIRSRSAAEVARTGAGRAPGSASRRRSFVRRARPARSTIRPAASESRASAASSGLDADDAARRPERPGRRRRSRWRARHRRSGRGPRRRRARPRRSPVRQVPWPAMTRPSSYGGMIDRPRSPRAARRWARRSSLPVPTITTSAPSASTRPRLIGGASDGITTTAGAPSSRAARATPWAWFPLE